MAGMNHEYDRPLVVGQIRTQMSQVAGITEHLGGIALAIEDVTGHLVGPDAHAWHTDNAARSLENDAQSLERAADALRHIAKHVLYPEPELTPEPPSSMLDGWQK